MGSDMPATQRRSQRERRSETEQRVLDAATTLIAQHGSRAVSLAEVGKVAGYSRGIVTHQFGTKQNLLEAVVRRAQDFTVPAQGETGLDQVAASVAGYLSSLHDRSPDGQAFLTLWSESVAGDATLAALFSERDAWFRDLLAGHLRRGVDDGSIRADIHADTVAVSLIGLLRGTAMLVMSTAADQPLPLLAEQAAAMIRGGLTRAHFGTAI